VPGWPNDTSRTEESIDLDLGRFFDEGGESVEGASYGQVPAAYRKRAVRGVAVCSAGRFEVLTAQI